MGLSCDLSDAKLVTARYDADEDGRLSYWEFANMFLPVETEIRKDLEFRTRQARFDGNTLNLFKSVLRAHLTTETLVESIRQRLGFNVPIKLKDVFNQIDYLDRGFLT
jgi:hypothetical protein